MQSHIYRFTVPVNCFLNNENEITDKQQDFEELFYDDGIIILPESYTDTGKATRLVIVCHGAGGSISSNDSQTEHNVFAQYLVANGYAVMDVNGLPSKYAARNGIDIRNNIGSPIALRSYVKAYHYCMDNYNFKHGVFVAGGSMGGISSTNLVLSGQIPVIAHCAFCPVLDTYNQIFLHPWSGGLPKAALGKIYGFETDGNGEYIYSEEKVRGFNPASNKKAEHYPVPVKFWHCIDDEVVPYSVTQAFIDRIKENGTAAYLRSLPYGGHEPQAVGEVVQKPLGSDMFFGNKIQVRPAVEEAFIWIRSFD